MAVANAMIKTVSWQQIDYFTFNNIKGRSGRMFEHFIGRVYLFNDPPPQQLPFVDFPVFSQGDDTPASLLIQLEDEDLSKDAKTRLEAIKGQRELPLSVIRENASIDPDAQVALAKEIAANPARMKSSLAWNGFPTWEQLRFACALIWKHFVGSRRMKATVTSGEQLAYKIDHLRQRQSVARRVKKELSPGKYAAKNVNEAVERVLDFDRTWATFKFPRYLMALSRIQSSVLPRLGFRAGDHSVFAGQVECLFRNPVIAALDEYGIPLPVGEEIQSELKVSEGLDAALSSLKLLDAGQLNLSAFELELVEDAQKAL